MVWSRKDNANHCDQFSLTKNAVMFPIRFPENGLKPFIIFLHRTKMKIQFSIGIPRQILRKILFFEC